MSKFSSVNAIEFYNQLKNIMPLFDFSYFEDEFEMNENMTRHKLYDCLGDFGFTFYERKNKKITYPLDAEERAHHGVYHFLINVTNNSKTMKEEIEISYHDEHGFYKPSTKKQQEHIYAFHDEEKDIIYHDGKIISCSELEEKNIGGLMKKLIDNVPIFEITMYDPVKYGDIQQQHDNFLKWSQEICAEFDIKYEKHYIYSVQLTKTIFYKIIDRLYLQYPDENEYDILSKTNLGGFLYADKGKQFSDGVCVDANSWYPSCQMSDSLLIPTRAGKTKIVQEIPKADCFCVRLKVEDGDKRLFYRNFNSQKNWFTMYDVKHMKLVGIKFAIIQDDHPNCIIWKDYIESSVLFKIPFEKLYKLKANGNKMAKLVANAFWGYAMQLNKGYISHEDLLKLPDSSENSRVLSYSDVFDRLLEDRNGTITYRIKNRPYSTPLARLGCMLASFARYRLVKKYVKPMIDAKHDILRIHTDSFVTTTTKEQIEKTLDTQFSNEIGKLKVEKQFFGKHMIKNVHCIEKCESLD